MKVFITILILFVLNITSSLSQSIRVNTIGYQPLDDKIATIIGNANSSFQLIDALDNKVVFEGRTGEEEWQNDTKEKYSLIDFSEFKKRGTFIIKVGSEQSPAFEINENVFLEPLKVSTKAFYLWRCGMAVSGEYKGEHFHHKACHLKDGYLDYDPDKTYKDGVGGWHDAGDYGKYTVNAGVTVASLLLAWQQFESTLKDLNLDLPEDKEITALPDFLKEIKYEIDFLFKMQYPDGSGKVSHKLTRKNFSGFIMPEKDNKKRYFTSWSTAATADFVAMMAMASRVFKPYNKWYANKCLSAAELSYECLKKYPDHVPFIQHDFTTGGYQTNDKDDRLWAASEMWVTTGENGYLQDFEKRFTQFNTKVVTNWDWDNVSNLGVFAYVLSKSKDRNMALVQEAEKACIQAADTLVNGTVNDAYGRSFDKYYWGCNGTVARQTINLQVANEISPDIKYKKATTNIVAHLLGRNFYGRSYITGLGYQPPLYPHSRRSGADKNKNPWPGYIVGGGHTAIDWVDKESSYSHNEIAINWQAAWVYALVAVQN
ncbi:glycoside hydrolase family 9 protein [Labilibacter marinus]|uniref:glycoside hydrolase family 9 protein n=1 Tax=Labilibacter marinus TaxID=1477105 RepID=UPI00094F7341|nr:glycoside hydrolase family 9 protein [Labilibacter marinus]